MTSMNKLTRSCSTKLSTSEAEMLTQPVESSDVSLVEPAIMLALNVAFRSDCRIELNIVKEEGFSWRVIPPQPIVRGLDMVECKFPPESSGFFDSSPTIFH